MTADLETRVRHSITNRVNEWTKTAWAEDEYTIWWFTPPDAPYPAARASITMPMLRVPAHIHRPEVMTQLENEVTLILDNLPFGVQHTPLLEAIFFIGATRDNPWSLVVYSDLIQDSAAWRDARQGSPADDQTAITNAMLTICPPVMTPPKEVVIVSWPGITAQHSDVHQHLRDRDAFAELFGSWAPEAVLTISFIE